jgi:hypothetical protein
VKTFVYRGNPAKEFSNRYYFDGGSPGDSDAWHTFMDAIVLLEQACITSDMHVTDVFGYAPGSEVAVATKTYAAAGTYGGSGGTATPGECCAILRMATTKKSTKNHTVYVFSYYHRALWQTASASSDTLATTQKTAIEGYAQDWLTGITVAGRAYHRTTPDGHLTTGRQVDQWIGHRDFPR